MKVTTDGCLFGAWLAQVRAGVRGNILDIGTGTGLLSLMLAQKGEDKIVAVENHYGSIQDAKNNFNHCKFNSKPILEATNILHYKPTNLFDCIICNPPFFKNHLPSPNQERNAAMHEQALDFPFLLQFAKANLNPNGSLYLMLHSQRQKELEELTLENNLSIQKLVLVHPAKKKSAFRIFVKIGAQKQEYEAEHLYIKEAFGDYTTEFKTLLKPYYLHF
jgi:tRNA1Val (adenine37-N6)-methyltransferase